jgi:hypothetical protein
VKVLLLFVIGVFVLAAMPRFDIIRRKPVWLLLAVAVVGASYTSLRVIGV